MTGDRGECGNLTVGGERCRLGSGQPEERLLVKNSKKGEGASVVLVVRGIATVHR